MKRIKKALKISGILAGIILAAFVIIFFSYCNSLQHVHPATVSYYQQLRGELQQRGYKPRLLVISSYRAPWHNRMLTRFGAARYSRHIQGDAIDILVMDVNRDGKMNTADVDIVYALLDEKIMPGTGGLGSYKHQRGFWNRQMVHLDCRSEKARWNR